MAVPMLSMSSKATAGGHHAVKRALLARFFVKQLDRASFAKTPFDRLDEFQIGQGLAPQFVRRIADGQQSGFRSRRYADGLRIVVSRSATPCACDGRVPIAGRIDVEIRRAVTADHAPVRRRFVARRLRSTSE